MDWSTEFCTIHEEKMFLDNREEIYYPMISMNEVDVTVQYEADMIVFVCGI